MLLAKLTKPVEKIYQNGGLNQTKVSAEYLAANIGSYAMGEIKTNFYYKIGKVEFDEKGKITNFNPVIRGFVDIDAKDLAEWGTDDFVALKAVAKALGVEVEETHFEYDGYFKS